MNDDLYVTPIFDDDGEQVATWVHATKNGYYAEVICSPHQARGEALSRLVDGLLIPEMMLEAKRDDLARLEAKVRDRRRQAGLTGAVSSGLAGKSPSALTKLFGPDGSTAAVGD